ncbi:hypothetical protein AAON49_06355 [Pseudotenacibaculum sp. MALMAid0570]|uniref:hypothetical protein n=1 Tax=Pseudotenacibaculum sp. MALMAid0570 TaxID=3143938 RepID=UPI0032DE6A8A
MKTQKIILSLAAFLMITMAGFSQIPQNNRISQYSIDFSRSADNSLGPVTGKLYINEKFSLAKISNYEGSTLLRYNPYKDEMEFMKGDQIYYLDKHAGIKVLFTKSNKNYVIKNVSGKLMYFIEKFKGDKLSFLVKEKVKYTPETKASDSYSSAKPARFSRSPDSFYVEFSDGLVSELPRKKKQILKFFKTKNIDLKSYFKKNKINLKKEKDAMKLIRDINKL